MTKYVPGRMNLSRAARSVGVEREAWRIAHREDSLPGDGLFEHCVCDNCQRHRLVSPLAPSLSPDDQNPV